MRIAHIVASLASRHGGPSRSVRELARAQARLDHEVEILVTGAAPSTEENENVTVRTFHRDIPQFACPSRQMSRFLHHSDYEVVHAHGVWLRPLHYAHHFSRTHAVPLVLAPRGMMTPWAWSHHRRRKQVARVLIHPGALEAVTGWHTTSEAETLEIKALGFQQPSCLASNGVALPTANQREESKAYWTPKAASLQGRRVALFYSRFHRKKRVLELINLWCQAPRPGWALLIVGIDDEYTIDTVRDHVTSQQKPDDFIMVCNGDGAPPPFGVADLFLLPSHSENFGLVVAESLAHAVPVLVTDGTPWQDVHVHAAGWCVGWAEFAGTLKSALALTTDELRNAGERGQAWVTQAFTWKKPAARLIEFYQELITSHRDLK
ncbi:glycosyltransferase [Synoicihabitans lomoniglobus]|uniref:Glycosyltransferase n=1 Tax=Synoicihabitans lomoniglobus TaxID=2909285 RepID=A0AAF0CSP2_9BACT|nr:glycosyltransferase [Opitutaceae bacterium LMO-M01]WED67342.1 glycosyltransferase [Opitutaceae bacterium LMO-M01]